MHIVFATDQHLDSAGGAQVSMRLQRRYLELAGHTVTVLAPPSRAAKGGDPNTVTLPGIPITPDREYSASPVGRATDRAVDLGLADKPPVDVVHVQADFWGAFIGYRLAERIDAPVVHTFHNNVGVGIRATMPAPHLVLGAFGLWQRRAMGSIRRAGGVGDYLAGFADRAAALIAPSRHFADTLVREGVGRGFEVLPTGVDDELLDQARAVPRVAGTPPRLVWLGRLSAEKRPLEFARALRSADLPASVDIIGGGTLEKALRRELGALADVRMLGRLSYPESLAAIRGADAVVQTSVGFETQGMTAYEAAALGTPVVYSDAAIAAELPGTGWQVPAAAEDGVPSDAELATTLQRAVADLATGAAPVPVPRWSTQLKQSALTRRMIGLYTDVLSGRRR